METIDLIFDHSEQIARLRAEQHRIMATVNREESVHAMDMAYLACADIGAYISKLELHEMDMHHAQILRANLECQLGR